MREMKLEPPFFLLCDNHRSHMSPAISIFCEEKAIHLLGLHPNATFAHQPLDVTLFRKYKQCWNKVIKGDCNNSVQQVRRSNVCTLVGRLMDTYDFSKDLQSGFEVTGLWPLNRDAIPESRFVKRNQANEHSNNKIEIFGADRPMYAKDYAVEDTQTCHLSTAIVDNVAGYNPLIVAPVTGYALSEAFPIENDIDSFMLPPKLQISEQIPLQSSFFEQIAVQQPKHLSETLSFASVAEFEYAAKEYAFKIIRNIYGPHLSDLIEQNNFEPMSANDFVILKTYKQFRPPTSLDNLLTAPSLPTKLKKEISPDWFKDDNLAHSSLAARKRMATPTDGQIKKAKEVEERKKKRSIEKQEKEKRLEIEKAEKAKEKQRIKDEKLKQVELEKEKKRQARLKRKHEPQKRQRKKVKIENKENRDVNNKEESESDLSIAEEALITNDMKDDEQFYSELAQQAKLFDL